MRFECNVSFDTVSQTMTQRMKSTDDTRQLLIHSFRSIVIETSYSALQYSVLVNVPNMFLAPRTKLYTLLWEFTQLFILIKNIQAKCYIYGASSCSCVALQRREDLYLVLFIACIGNHSQVKNYYLFDMIPENEGTTKVVNVCKNDSNR